MATSIPHRDRSPRRLAGASLWALIGTAIVAVAAAIFFGSRSSAFHARAIEVVGAAHLSRAEVVAAAGVSRQTNVLWFDEGAVVRRLEGEPWIASADVGLALPWTIRITVIERTPVAVASAGADAILVAGDGTALGPATRSGDLPRIRLPLGPTFEGLHASPAAAAAAVGALAPEVRDRISWVTVLADGIIQMRLEGGVTVRYGTASDIRRKAETLEQILAWAEAEGQTITMVNVVAPDLPAVKLAA